MAKDRRVEVEKEMVEKIGMVEENLSSVEKVTKLAPDLLNEVVSMLDQRVFGR